VSSARGPPLISDTPCLYLGQTSRTIRDTFSSARIQSIKAARREAICSAFWRSPANASASDRSDSKAAQVELDMYPRDLRQHRRQTDITRDGFGPKRRAPTDKAGTCLCEHDARAMEHAGHLSFWGLIDKGILQVSFCNHPRPMNLKTTGQRATG